MNVRKSADCLVRAGISSIPENVIDRVEKTIEGLPPEVIETMNIEAMLLDGVGRGLYDYKTHIWQPTSEQIYSFDVEAYDIGEMYTNFLRGITSINKQEFEITQIEEKLNLMDDGQEEEIHIISFCYNGNSYEFRSNEESGWFDSKMLDYMNEILEKEGNSKRLYFMGDGYQACIVFYCTQEWAENFGRKTDCYLCNF